MRDLGVHVPEPVVVQYVQVRSQQQEIVRSVYPWDPQISDESVLENKQLCDMARVLLSSPRHG
jgi:hypothetical protein